MEEVARRYGYQNIPTTYPWMPADTRRFSKRLRIRDQIKTLMCGFGFTEAVTYSFIHEASCDRLGMAFQDPRRNTVKVLNPLSEEQAVLRTSLIPGLLETEHRNLSQQIKNLKLFEIGKIFIHTGSNNLPEEIEMTAGLWTGSRNESSWHQRETDCDFYDIKGIVEGLLEGLSMNGIRFTALAEEACTYIEPGRSARIFMGETVLGVVGELSHRVMRRYDIKQRTFIFELNFELMLSNATLLRFTRPIPKYPSVSRDVTLIVDKCLETQAILERVQGAGIELVEEIRLFDVFEGEPIPPGKKSISFRITYRSSMETLLDEKVTNLHKNMTLKLVKAFDAALPG
jgi:phenylalanyl-tRNA synthetase beta chain